MIRRGVNDPLTPPGASAQCHKFVLHKSHCEIQYDIFFIHICQEIVKCHKMEFTTPPMTIQVPKGLIEK